MNKRYLITGVSGVDPYTNIYLVPQIITEKIIDDGSKIEIKYKNNKDTKIPQEVKLDEIFIDGSMLNILRKYIKNGNPITDIYIYLTQEMKKRTQIYETSIKNLYESNGINNFNIVFYPNDFYEECEERFRADDVQKFASYYKEIYEIYSKIIKQGNSDEIILNISSGTPAFKADMMIMAVTNNLKIEQTANSIESKDLKNYVMQKEKVLYDDIKQKLEDAKLNYKDAKTKIQIESRQIKDFQIDKINEQLDFLNETENSLETRTSRESIDEIKKIILLESIEDSIQKKDYCGIYYNLKSNEQYLKNNKQKLLEIAGNLYYRYIGNDEKAKKSIQNNLQNNIENYYPIYKASSIKNCTDELKEEINAIIEKSNIMKIKSQREEINDWLLISTPLIEAISSLIVTQKTKFNFENIISKSNNKSTISLNLFNKIAPKEIKERYENVVKESDNNFLNAFFYKNIIFQMLKTEDKQEEKKHINKILDYIYIVDLARTARVSAAHSIQNISKNEFESLYKDKLLRHSRYYSLKNITKNYINQQENQSIKCVENAVKELIVDLLPDNNEETIKYFEESINIYNTLEQAILKLLKDEIYN
mgnify:FL=1